ncbi:SPBc2 prophage-derived endonuclease YokF [Brevibacillus aydinogluensis]|uniref:SPBc2 prophage-derived endonuclease YokF n=1 Tax=Brevibacillus aydinogluensis TaxID=927786 RepID=A0AA48MAW7_9BACL|nr:SPBc2 prophage-derived endonuclease YokF [Brevibacillus aydinogluensis]
MLSICVDMYLLMTKVLVLYAGKGREETDVQYLVALALIGLVIYFIVSYWVGILLIVLTGLLAYQAYRKGLTSKAGKWAAGGAAFFALAFFGWLGSDEPTVMVPNNTTTVSQTSTSKSEPVKTDTVSTASTNAVQPAPSAVEATTSAPTTAVSTQQSEAVPARIQAKVTDVVDGDTFKVTINGKEETVRMLLIDTPETKHPQKPVQPFGPEASKFTKDLLTGKTVELEKDVSEQDKYGRLLAYVYVDGQSVQEKLLEKGLARVAVYPPDVKNVDKYRDIQEKAQKAGVGIWSIENYAQEDGFHSELVKKNGPGPDQKTTGAKSTQPTKTQPAPAHTKTPEQIQQEVHQEYVFFNNCSEARAAGAAPIYRGEPGYRPKLDRDNDGVACE